MSEKNNMDKKLVIYDGAKNSGLRLNWGARKIKLIILAVVLIALLAIVAIIFGKGYNKAKAKYEEEIAKLEQRVEELSDQTAVYEEHPSKEVSLSAIKTQIQDIGELATIEYLYTDAGKYESAKQLWGKDIIFTNKSFVAKWDGIIKAGIEIDEINVDLDEENKTIHIQIPNAKILSHEIDEESFETLDEKNGLFNRIEVADIREFDLQSKQAMEKRAIEAGILNKALANAKDIIRKLVYTDELKELGYSVDIEVVEK